MKGKFNNDPSVAGGKQDILNIPNARVLLKPSQSHPAHNLWNDILVVSSQIDTDGKGWVCDHCRQALQLGRLPKLALNNNLWIGETPHVLHILTFVELLLVAQHYPRCYVFKLYPREGGRGFNPRHLQRAMAGNVTLYKVNMAAMADMLEGRLLPQTVTALCSVLAITFIGTKTLPQDWLKWTFRVRQEAVHDALCWLQANNPLYEDICISHEQLHMLPENGIPAELEAVIRYEEDAGMAMQEREGYILNEEDVEEGKQ